MEDRRHFLKTVGVGALAYSATSAMGQAPRSDKFPLPLRSAFNVREFGAKGDGVTIDTQSINRTIDLVASNGGGTVFFPAGTYASYSIQLKSRVTLLFDSGATILAASVPDAGTTSGGYDAAESNGEWEQYQDYGHNHWHNSLVWGEGLNDIAIIGTGLIWGKGLSRGLTELPRAESPGVGNKTIALKNCRNVLLRDFSILKGGHFGILATGVDNLTIDNLTIDTDRDGMDIDCCRNVRISNCSVNSPWDDGICPKSSFALGYARSTENVTISNCYVTGAYELGTMLDGTWKRIPPDAKVPRTGRIKCGTESNGGFKNITVTNCVFDGCRGIALETVDGAQLEDIAFTNITMRNCTNTPIFLRLGTRMRTPKGQPVGTLRRVLLSNIVSYNCVPQFACIIAGVPGYDVEDIKLSNLYLHHQGGGTPRMAALTPAEDADKYPEPRMFGDLPASGFFLRHARNLEFSNVEIATEAPDARPAFWMDDVKGADFFRLKLPGATPRFRLSNVMDFSVLASRGIKDTVLSEAKQEQF